MSEENKVIHIVAQGKGGGGKSLVAAALMEFLILKGLQPVGFDCDPINQTFANIKALGVTHHQIVNQFNAIDEKRFDALIEALIEADKPVVVDNGSSNFSALMSYLIESGAIDVLVDSGKVVKFHTPLMGGDFFEDMASTLDLMMRSFPVASFVVWENGFKGEVGREENGALISVSDLKFYKNPLIIASPKIKGYNPATFGKDLIKKGQKNLTFNEAMESTDFSVMERKRLKTIWSDLEQAASVATGIPV